MRKAFGTLLLSLFFYASPAQWNSDSLVNLETSSYSSSVILTSPTSTGGTYVTIYKPNASGFFDMVVQYLDVNGNKQFGPDGIILNSYPANSATFVYNIITDAQDNLILAFQDQRAGGSSNSAVAYKINTSGQSLWETTPGTGDGLLLGGGLAPYPCQLSTGDYVFAWTNNANRISVQKITAGGALAWASPIEIFPITTGRGISRAQLVPHTGGKWGMVFQQRNGTVGSPLPTTLFEKQFDSDGLLLWTSTALSNTVTANSRYYSVLSVGDETYIGYFANPAAQNRFDGFVQKVNGDGSLPWGINGSDFSTEQVYYEMTINIVYNTALGEVWAVQTFSNTNQTQYGIYSQRFNAATGARQLGDFAKTLFPVSANREQTWPTNMGLCSDGGLMFMFYSDVSNNIFASKINTAGGFMWPADRKMLAATTNTKGRYNFSVSANNGVAVWQETRAGTPLAYAQNITSAGNLGLLPVYVEYFNGSKQGNDHLLRWKLNPVSTNTGTITLERSADGRSFSSIYSITVPASRMHQPFEYTDAQPLNGSNYYRLKLRDDNGHITYSQVVVLLNKTSGTEIVLLFPNPAVGTAQLLVTSTANTTLQLQLNDMAGRRIMQRSFQVNAGSNNLVLDISKIPAGSYLLTGWIQGEQPRTIRLLKE